MPRNTYEQVGIAVCAADTYFMQKFDAVGIPGATTDRKHLCSSTIVLSVPADAMVDYAGLGELTNMECLKRFAAVVVSELVEEWLRASTAEYLQRIESQYGKLGFPGCIGCVDIASWE